MSNDFFSDNVVDFPLEAEGSGHPSPVDEAHDCSLGRFESSEKTQCCWFSKTDFI